MSVSSTVQKLEYGPRNVSFHLTGLGDGGGQETLVKKVDAQLLQPVSLRLRFERISGVVDYGAVILYWDAPIPTRIAVLSGQFNLDFTRIGGLTNNAASPTGSVLLSTVGFELNSTYDILIELVK